MTRFHSAISADGRVFKPRTRLAKRIWELRQHAIDSGMPLSPEAQAIIDAGLREYDQAHPSRLMPDWVSVKDDLPAENQDIDVWFHSPVTNKLKRVTDCRYTEAWGFQWPCEPTDSGWGQFASVAYWAPVSEPPEEA